MGDFLAGLGDSPGFLFKCEPGAKPQSRSEADFCRPGPLTGRVFAISINTHVKHYTKMICVVLKLKPNPAMSGDMAYITCCRFKDYESPLGSAPNLRLNSRFQNERGIGRASFML